MACLLLVQIFGTFVLPVAGLNRIAWVDWACVTSALFLIVLSVRKWLQTKHSFGDEDNKK